jgi:hypothetical protein
MTTLTIDSVRHDFNVWRTSRAKKGRIPDHLWDKVMKLLDYYPIGKVASALQLSGGQVIAKREQFKSHSTTMPVTTPVNFVELNMPSVMHGCTPVANSSSRVEIKRSDGSVLAIEHLSEQAMLQLLNQFTRGI